MDGRSGSIRRLFRSLALRFGLSGTPLPELHRRERQEPSIPDIARSIISSVRESIRQNRLASSLALVAFLVVLPLTFGSRYDERPRYRQVILPEVERFEEDYLSALQRSETAPTDTWRLYHFLDAHNRAVKVLKFVRSKRTVTPDGRRAHAALIQYYELVDQHFAILRTRMSIDEEIDFLERWREITRDLQPIHDRWARWVNQ